ncbi:ARM repeat-containing protein [Aureobasidium sp. EXF-3400]|nr:ARM repeat-containing protein [Aureobasidium sp. EXF-12344]KAI4780480.1 ARM repeat-containing protein [Aureobasidium sp. EXF-3400]
MAEEQEDFSKLPLADRFVNKNWKVRKEAYEAATKEFKTAQPSDPLVKDFTADSNIWKGAVADANVAAQAEGLNALNAFLEIAGKSGCTRTRTSTIQPIVEKGVTGRPAAKAAAIEALLLYVELDVADPVIEELIPLLSAKTPKVIVAALQSLTAIYHAYGCKTVEPKPIIKLLPKVYGHADKNVRAEAQNLTVELYRWLKEAMKPLFWGELKPVQQTDLDKLFEKVKDDKPTQERLLRSQQAAQEAAEEAGDAPAEQAEDDDEEGAIDLEPEFEVVDVMSKVPADFSERLNSSKWKDRKEALEELFTAANQPAIQEGPFDDVMRGLAKSMKDANVACVIAAANCVEVLAKGLKKSFSRYRSTIMSPMLERLKEKKQTVTDALAAACDAVVSATGLTDNLEEMLEAFKHKTPQVKLESARVLVRCLKNLREVPPPAELKTMSDAAKTLLADSQAPPREAAAEILGTLWKIMTDRNMLPHLDGIDDIKKNKIKEYCDNAEVKVKWKPKAAPPPKPAAAPVKKPAPGRRPAPGVKKAAPAPVRPATPEEPPAAAPLAARPTSRPGGLKSGLAAPGSKMRKPGMAPPAASPRRVPSEDVEMLDDPPTPAPAPRSGLAAPRSLASRPLGKPTNSFNQSTNEPPQEYAPPPQAAPSVLSLAERSELSDLRSEAEYLRSQNSELRTDKMRLNSQIHELQNQNAQLIEDHTRDVLGIKAKETQLVRARSDAEAAEERAAGLAREVDRLKREVARLGRVERDHNQDTQMHNSGYSESNGANGMRHYDTPMGGMGPPRPQFGRPGAGMSYPSSQSREPSGETKEHSDAAAGLERITSPVSGFRSSNAPSLDHSSSGRASPAVSGLQRSGSGSRPGSNMEQGYGAAMGADSGIQRSSMSRPQGGEGAAGGVESWRRAAEVTQNLKARIEMMKAKQQSLQRNH